MVYIIVPLLAVLVITGLAVYLDRRWNSCKAVGSILILAITAGAIVWYTNETRRMADSTESLAREAPLMHELWRQRMDLYARLSGTLNLYYTGLSHEKVDPSAAQRMARERTELLLFIPDKEDPVHEFMKCDIHRLEQALVKAETRQDKTEIVSEILLGWRAAVRKSLRLDELE